MIELTEKANCSGCGACKNICPKSCIEMKLDGEGFLYPVLDRGKCINCGLCNDVCHLKYTFTRNDNEECAFFGAYNKETMIIKDSSSGGIFWLLAKYVINNNGIVYGVVLKNNFYITHERAETLEACEGFRKSKYLESDTGLIYQSVKRDLNNDKLVLFSGTPCQVAGLYSFLGKDYDNLLTCDIVCHGVPSKVVFDKYIQEVNRVHNDTAISIIWRDKRNGWAPNMISIKFASGKEIISTSIKNSYQRGFLNNLYLRPSCYECPYAKLPRIGDISLGDFWGYEGVLKDSNQNNGLSIVILSSENGRIAFQQIKDKCMIEAVSKDYIIRKSKNTHTKPKYNKDREAFFKDLDKINYKKLYRKYLLPSIFKRGYQKIKKLMVK